MSPGNLLEIMPTDLLDTLLLDNYLHMMYFAFQFYWESIPSTSLFIQSWALYPVTDERSVY